MDNFLVDSKVRETIRKNAAISYGLTIVVGLPLPSLLCNSLGKIQTQVEGVMPDRFTWYRQGQFHTTAFAPLLGRYRASPPLQRNDLPRDPDAFISVLRRCFADLQPFSLTFAKLILAPNGMLLATSRDQTWVRQEVARCLQPFPELDSPKHLAEWHITLGYLHTPAPFGSEDESARLTALLADLQAHLTLRVTVRQMWLVHYSNRTMSGIVGKTRLILGQANRISAASLLADLKIAQP